MLPKRFQIYTRNNAEEQITTKNKIEVIFSLWLLMYMHVVRGPLVKKGAQVQNHDPWLKNCRQRIFNNTNT
jgi:hypothetical protein